jgi:hypothetical protein
VKGGQFYTDSHFVFGARAPRRSAVRQPIRATIRDWLCDNITEPIRMLGGFLASGMAIWSGTSVRLR